MYVQLKDGSCFDIVEEKASDTAIVLTPLSKQQEVNNAYKAFNKEKNLSLFLFKTSTGTAAQYENYIFDRMSMEGEEGAYTVTMHAHPMSEIEVLQEAIIAAINAVSEMQEAQNEALDYILMKEAIEDGEVSGDENQTGEA